MERELRAADVNAAVFAYSAGRYSPLQAYLAVRKPARDYSASAVVLNVYTGNDFYDMLRVDDRPHLRRNNGGYEIAEPTWYVYDPPEVRHRSRVLHALRSLTNAIGVRELWLRTKYLRDFAGQQGKGLAVVVAYMNDLRKSRAPEVGYPGAFSAQILNQQLFFHRFPESRDESVARVRALLELARREIPGALLVLSALPSYQLVQQQPVDSALLRTLARLPVTYEGGVREEAALYESLRTLAAQAGWLFVDNLQPLREYQGRERLYNAFDYHFQPAASEIIGRAQATAIADHLRRPSMTGTAPAAR
jgi:hypothetical protein